DHPSKDAVGFPGRRPAPSLSLCYLLWKILLELDVAQNNFDAITRTQVPSKLFSKEDRPVLASCATERNHQIREAATLISRHRGIYEGLCSFKILMHTFLLI